MGMEMGWLRRRVFLVRKVRIRIFFIIDQGGSGNMNMMNIGMGEDEEYSSISRFDNM